MKKSTLTILMLVVLASGSCGDRKKVKTEPGRPDMSALRGKPTDLVICRLDSNNSYALYLPSSYDATHTWPVIIAFDSHGDGRMPVYLLQEQAEKYSYIVIGSNNSKNGLSTEVTSGIYDALLADASWRFSLDKNRIYTMGFSGGARVAAYQALTKPGIKGVIGCSAGFPGISSPPSTVFDFLGIAGNFDFNLLEMRRLMTTLDQSPIPHVLMTFDGIHEWPPKEMIPDIFFWLQLNAMKSRLIPVDTTYVSLVDHDFLHRIDLLKKEKKWTKSLEISKLGENFLSTFPQAKNFQNITAALMSRNEVKQSLKIQEDWLNKEQTLQGDYSKFLTEKNIDWWKKEIIRLNGLVKQKSGTEEANVYKRVLSYLSLVCYMQATGALKAGQMDPFRYFVLLYTLVDPENPEHAYLQAVADIRDKKEKEALSSLKKAVQLGFKEKNRMEKDSNFLEIKNLPEFQQILGTIGK
ncbi:MAG: hypothetical protein NTU44_15565 [Bacteroidetes bacterium]|nr:hypothetical protein [Bacteroidota bacterium]